MRRGFAATGMLVTMIILFVVVLAAWKNVGMVVAMTRAQEKEAARFLQATEVLQRAQRLVVKGYDELMKVKRLNHVVVDLGSRPEVATLACGSASAWPYKPKLPGLVCRLTISYTSAPLIWRFCIVKRESQYVCSPCRLSYMSSL